MNQEPKLHGLFSSRQFLKYSVVTANNFKIKNDRVGILRNESIFVDLMYV